MAAPISAFPQAPNRGGDPYEFSNAMDAFLNHLVANFVGEVNAFSRALNTFSTNSSSTTSLSISKSTKTLTVEEDKSYMSGMSVKIASSATPSKWMAGDVQTYNASNGQLIVEIYLIRGSGTFTDWIITAAAANSGDFQPGDSLMFPMTAAPIGWTQDTSDNANNRMLRVVSGFGGSVGGSHSPVLNDVVPEHAHPFTTGNESQGHVHSIGDPGHAHSFYTVAPNANGDSGGGDPEGVGKRNESTSSSGTGINIGGPSNSHYHSGNTDNNASPSNWTPRFINLILCSKD